MEKLTMNRQTVDIPYRSAAWAAIAAWAASVLLICCQHAAYNAAFQQHVCKLCCNHSMGWKYAARMLHLQHGHAARMLLNVSLDSIMLPQCCKMLVLILSCCQNAAKC